MYSLHVDLISIFKLQAVLLVLIRSVALFFIERLLID